MPGLGAGVARFGADGLTRGEALIAGWTLLGVLGLFFGALIRKRRS